MPTIILRRLICIIYIIFSHQKPHLLWLTVPINLALRCIPVNQY